MGTAVEVTGVSKRFRLYRETLTSVKERVVRLGRVPFEDFWALRDVDLEIAQGETVGLIGHNGCGKSTLLNCIAGILEPTAGEIHVEGRLAALLELGSGFHPDLSGRENVFLNASLLGVPRSEVAKRFDEIVAFAELEQFIDNQVKHYSSGMYARLGFAVAVNMEPDVLLVDEVLSVGDESFQRRCLDRIRQFQREGRTIVLVSHASDLVRMICDRAAVLDEGRLVAVGPPGEAIRAFREHLLERDRRGEADRFLAGGESGAAADSPQAKRNLKIRIDEVRIEHPGSDERPYLLPGQSLRITMGYEAVERIDDVVFGIAVYDLEGRLIFGSNTDLLGVPVNAAEGRAQVVFETDTVPLLDGTYLLTFGVHSHDEGIVYDWSEQQHQFEVMSPARSAGLVDMRVRAKVEDRP
jgi:ABC-2 type transport system ATP-binding protein